MNQDYHLPRFMTACIVLSRATFRKSRKEPSPGMNMQSHRRLVTVRIHQRFPLLLQRYHAPPTSFLIPFRTTNPRYSPLPPQIFFSPAHSSRNSVWIEGSFPNKFAITPLDFSSFNGSEGRFDSDVEEEQVLWIARGKNSRLNREKRGKTNARVGLTT